MPYHTHGLYPTFALHTGDSVVVLVQHIPVALWRTVTIMLKLLDFSCLTVSLSSLGLTHSTPYRSPLKQQLNFWSISRQNVLLKHVVFLCISYPTFIIIHPCSSLKTNTYRPTGQLGVTLPTVSEWATRAIFSLGQVPDLRWESRWVENWMLFEQQKSPVKMGSSW